MNTSTIASIESLEERRLMSVVQNGTILYVEGTSRADTISIQASHERGLEGRFDLSISVRGALIDNQNMPMSDITRVIVRANPFTDVLRADPTLPMPVTFVSDAAAGVTLADGILAVQGGKGADVIRVYRNRGMAEDITVVLNGQESRYSSEVAKVLLINGNRGANDIAIGKVGLPQLVFGGDDNDRITGGREDDYFSGNLGDDTMLGGAGDDQLFGVDGADLIDGGDGNDGITLASGPATVLGGNGDDALFVNIAGAKFTGGPGRDQMLSGGTVAEFLDFDAQDDTFSRVH